MDKFESLLLRMGHPGEVQDQVRRELPRHLAESKLNLWKPNSRFASIGKRFLIGIITWSIYDMRLLDALDHVLFKEQRAERVDIFNVDDCPTPECIEQYLPGVGKVYQTPVVGIWQDGKQVYSGSGYDGRMAVATHFDIDYGRLVRLPSEV